MKPEPPTTLTRRFRMGYLPLLNAAPRPQLTRGLYTTTAGLMARAAGRITSRPANPSQETLTSAGPAPYPVPACPDGGIGRRAGFRYLWPKGRGGSSPLLGTMFSARIEPPYQPSMRA